MKGYVVLILFAFAFTQGCGSSKPVQEEKYPTLTWGDGGGFAGIETRYILQRDGRLYRSITKQGQQEMKRLDEETVDQLFKNAELLDLQEMRYQRPGNLYRFIEYGDEEPLNRIVWDPDLPGRLDGNVLIFYRNLMHLITHSH